MSELSISFSLLVASAATGRPRRVPFRNSDTLVPMRAQSSNGSGREELGGISLRVVAVANHHVSPRKRSALTTTAITTTVAHPGEDEGMRTRGGGFLKYAVTGEGVSKVS